MTHACLLPVRRLLAALVPLALGLAAAQTVEFDRRAIVVNPVADFGVEVWLDRDGSGDGVPVYEIGEPVRISVRAERDAYVYLFDVASDGEVTQILPNRLDGDGRATLLPAGTTRTFPPAGARYEFEVRGPGGPSKVIAVASERPLATEELASFRSGDAFATSSIGERGFAERFSIVVRPVAPEAWSTDTALYRVGARAAPAPAPVRGTLAVASEPSALDVYVDGRFVGLTPVRVEVAPGSVGVEVRRGERHHRATVDVAAGAVRRVDADLRDREPRRVRLSRRPELWAPAGSEIVSRERDDGEDEIRFRTPATLEALHEDLHRQLLAAGWKRVRFATRGGYVDSRYRRGDRRLDFDLRGGELPRLQLRERRIDDD